MKALIVAVLAASAAAHAEEKASPGSRLSFREVAQLRGGMTTSEVIAKLGRPGVEMKTPCLFDGDGECLVYDNARDGFAAGVLLSFRPAADRGGLMLLQGIFLLGRDEAEAMARTEVKSTSGMRQSAPPATGDQRSASPGAGRASPGAPPPGPSSATASPGEPPASPGSPGKATREAARQLEIGMKTEQVRALLGEPAATSQQTCGGALDNPTWPCRIWTYQGQALGFRGLRVVFQPCEDAWCVNGWQ